MTDDGRCLKNLQQQYKAAGKERESISTQLTEPAGDNTMLNAQNKFK